MLPPMTHRAEDVLRYWLAAIRTEEAMSLRVRAERPRGRRKLDLIEPGRGQTYFKLMDEDAAPFLLRETLAVEREVSEDRLGFLEHTLREAYRRERWSRGADEDPPPLVVGFPVIFDPRRGELRTVLRFELDSMAWRDAVGQGWEPPTARERARGAPTPPMILRLRADLPPEDELPYTLDEDVLARALGVPDENIGRFLRRMASEGIRSPIEMARWVGGLLTTPEGEDEQLEPLPALEGTELLEAITQAVSARLAGTGRRAWPIGLVYDGGMIFATHYLQRDLRELASGRAEIRPSSPLDRYLTGRTRHAERRVHVGCRPGRPLTASQRRVAERFLGSRLTAAQGPPGTGKTELILALSAQALIERAGRLARGKASKMPMTPQLVVASTNNRAVDNVIDPLTGDLARLPLALRLGSRIVVHQVTVPFLRRTADWLRRASEEQATRVFAEERIRLTEQTEALEEAEGDWRRWETAAASARTAEAQVSQLEADLSAANARMEAEGLSPETIALDLGLARGAEAALKVLEERLREELAKLVRSRRKRKTPQIKRCWAAISPEKNRELDQHLEALELRFERPTAPDEEAPLAEHVSSLEEAVNALYEVHDEVTDRLERLRGLDTTGLQAALEAVRERLRPDESSTDDDQGPALEAELRAVVARIEPGLFETALRFREAWAVLNRERLIAALERIASELDATRSPRRAAQKNATEWALVMRLFPVVGCTLLSMGNAFPMEHKAIGRLVIDEAGQCHPAHAISGLVRAERALVIGDIHQLEPVISLDDWDEARVRRRIASPLHGEALLPFRTLASGGTSAQSLAERACLEVPALLDHYRCQPEIIAVNATLAGYQLEVHTPRASLGDHCDLLHAPLLGVDIRGDQAAWQGSWRNDAEVAACVRLLQQITAAGVATRRICVLTPYRAQLRALENGLRAAKIPVEDRDLSDRDPAQTSLLPGLMVTEDPGVTLGTVHRFQGGERDIVLLSTVVTRERSLAFTNARLNLLNVAISRARQHLVLVGDRPMLSRGRFTRVLVDAIGETGWLTQTA